MNIDPEMIPCAYCGSTDSIFTHGSFDVTNGIKCLTCDAETSPENWITGGINALAGKLMRQDIFICKTYKGWTWDKISEDETKEKDGGIFQSFEECILDAWEKTREEENGLRGGGPSL